MKTLIISLGVLMIALVLFISLRGNDSKNVPEKVKAAFAKLYPSVKDVKWSTEEGNYEGRFNYKSKDMSVQINNNGELVQRETYLKSSDLPKPAQDYLSKNYSGVSFDEYSEVTDSKNIKHYQAETKDKTIYFDTSGKFMKAETNDEDNEKDEDND